MAGGILQLVARSHDDIYLINDPQITLFKTVYRRYSNFSIDNKNLRFNKNVSFDSKGVCNLKKYGDLLHKLYLVINLPEIDMIYQSLTYQDVYNILLTAGIIWEYNGNPTDKVKISDLPNIYETIINAMNEYEQNIALIQINNLIPLNELYNYYTNNTLDDQSGITFLQNYIGGIDSSFNGIIYNEINDNPIDPTITKSIISEYNFTESYKKDKCYQNILNLNTLQPFVYDIYQNFILYPNYNYTYTGDISSTTISSITLKNINTLSLNDLSYNYFKNSYINTGIQLSFVDTYNNTSKKCNLLNNQNYLPDIINEKYSLINTPTDYINGLIYNKKKIIKPLKNPYYNKYNYYQSYLCVLYDNIDGLQNNTIATKILNYDDNINKNFIIDLDNIPNPAFHRIDYPSNIYWYRQFMYLTSNYQTLTITDISLNILNNRYYFQTNIPINIIVNNSSFFAYSTYIVLDNKIYGIDQSNNYYYIITDPKLENIPDIQINNTIYAFNFIKTISDVFNINNIYISYYANPQITNISNKIIIFNDTYAHIYDASSINTTKLILNTSTNPYVKFLDLSNNIKLAVPTIIQNCNITNTSYINTFSYTDFSNNIINFENMYILYQSELHQIKSSDISGNSITLQLKDIFKYDNSYYNTSNFIIIKKVNSFYDTSGTSGNNQIELINIVGANVVGKILYYNNNIAYISAINGNTITITPTLTNMPKYLDTCYIMDVSSIVYKTNIQNININRISYITLNIDVSNYDYKYFISNYKKYNIISTDVSSIIIDCSTNFNISNNVNNYLITDIDISSNIIDICGNKILYFSYESSLNETLSYIQNDICNNHYYTLIYNNQSYLLTYPTSFTDFTYKIFTTKFNTPIINMPQNNDLYTITLSVQYDVSNVIQLQRYNKIVCINDNTNINYTNYNISINNQLVKIKYYDTIYKLCVLDEQLIFLNNELINANCLLFNNNMISLNSTLRNDSIITKNNNIYQYIVYLNLLSSSEKNYYNNWYIQIINFYNNISELHQIIYYDNINKLAYLDSNFINGPPPTGSIYNLYEQLNIINCNTLKLPNNIFSISIKNNTNDYINSLLHINNESNTITYFDNYICIIEKQCSQLFGNDISFNISNNIQEMYKYNYNGPFNNAFKLQRNKLNTTDDYYNNMYINIGNETHEIISYDGTGNNIIIDSSGWLNQNDISNNYYIYDIYDYSGTIINSQNNIIIDNNGIDYKNYNIIFYDNYYSYAIMNYNVSGEFTYNNIWMIPPTITDVIYLYPNIYNNIFATSFIQLYNNNNTIINVNYNIDISNTDYIIYNNELHQLTNITNTSNKNTIIYNLNFANIFYELSSNTVSGTTYALYNNIMPPLSQITNTAAVFKDASSSSYIIDLSRSYITNYSSYIWHIYVGNNSNTAIHINRNDTSNVKSFTKKPNSNSYSITPVLNSDLDNAMRNLVGIYKYGISVAQNYTSYAFGNILYYNKIGTNFIYNTIIDFNGNFSQNNYFLLNKVYFTKITENNPINYIKQITVSGIPWKVSPSYNSTVYLLHQNIIQNYYITCNYINNTRYTYNSNNVNIDNCYYIYNDTTKLIYPFYKKSTASGYVTLLDISYNQNYTTYKLFMKPDISNNNHLINNGLILQSYPTGVYLENNNLSQINYFYDNNYLRMNNRIYQIDRYFEDTTYVIIDNNQSVDISSVIVNETQFNLFPRLLPNIEISNVINISNNIITLNEQSSKINNYYNNWYIDISNTQYYIISYDATKLQATISGNIINTSSYYKLYNNFIEDNFKLYNAIYISLYKSNLNNSLQTIFDSIIQLNLPTTIINSDFYKIYVVYTQINNFINIELSTINYNNVKLYLLAYLYNSFINNISQILKIFELLYMNRYKDPHYMFLFYYEYNSPRKIFLNTSLNNTLSNNTINLNDNFTNQIKTINTSFYSDYVNTSVTNFHYNNQNIHNNNIFLDYYTDLLIWKLSGLQILINDLSNTYLLNNVPLIVGNDICILIKSRLLNNNIDINFVNNLYNYLINTNNDMLHILNKDIALTDNDKLYIKQNISSSKTVLINLFKPYNSYYIDVDIDILNNSNLTDIKYNNLSAIEYVCYNLLYIGYYYTIQYNNLSNIDIVFKHIYDSVYTFLMTPDTIPSYNTYIINNYKLQPSDPSNLSNILSSIWNYINLNMIASYNNLYSQILNIDYYTISLGNYSKQLLYRCFDSMDIDINDTVNYYNYDFQKINKATNIITNELNAINILYNKNNNYNNILNVKNSIIDPYNYYYNNINNTYIGIQSSINNYINIFDPYYQNIFNGTINILTQLYKCTFDIIGDISNYVSNKKNYINTYIYGDSSNNPFNIIIEPNLYNWYIKYHSDISHNEFINIMSNITSLSLFNNKLIIDAFYNGFKTDSDVIQYIADTFAKQTDLNNLFTYVKNNWVQTYNNLLQYFNKQINNYNNNLIKIGYKNDPPTMYAEINDAISNQIPYFAWIKYLGYYLIDHCSITIGGCEIDKHTGEYMAVNNAINYDSDKNNGLSHMIGHLPELYTYDSNRKKSVDLYIPLNFWFCTDSGHALPLVAMNYTEIDFNLSLKKLEDVAYWSKLSIFKKKPILKTSLIAQYIYLDENERNIISKSKHEHLIENIQYMNYTYSYRDIKNNSIDPYIYFNNMCKELMWSVQPDNNYINYNNISRFEPKWYEYGFNNGTINTHIKGIYKWDASNNTTYVDVFNNPSPWISNDGTLTDISGNMIPLQYIINSNKYNIPHNNLYYDSSGNLYDDTNSLVLYNHVIDSSDNIYLLDSYLSDSSINYINPSQNITINMNGNHREETKDFMYYNYVQSNTRHKTSLPNGIYSYSFAIYPKMFQPSGALNLSKIENINLVIELNPDLIQAMKNNKTKVKCVIYAKTYNVLRIMSGMAGLAFFG
jgi:hypothetical protein